MRASAGGRKSGGTNDENEENGRCGWGWQRLVQNDMREDERGEEGTRWAGRDAPCLVEEPLDVRAGQPTECVEALPDKR